MYSNLTKPPSYFKWTLIRKEIQVHRSPVWETDLKFGRDMVDASISCVVTPNLKSCSHWRNKAWTRLSTIVYESGFRPQLTQLLFLLYTLEVMMY